ncbi:MAG: molybdenum cofactor biosynthesis protein MoaE [Mariniblastus sp.]|nr:molybdenum cofactor biosynthesis protein MoaE [Mariniblastus sp.]
MIKIVVDSIDERATLESVKSNRCGAALLFVGSTRQFTGPRETEQLKYECYEEMAVKVLSDLRRQAMEKWPLEACSVVHRVGTVEVGQASIAVAASSPHRADSFEALAWLMDQIKQQVPIWKQENWADGTREWIHPGAGQKPDTPEAAAEKG